MTRMRRLLLASAALLAGCHDDLVAPRGAPEPALMLAAIRCTADPGARRVQCDRPVGTITRTPQGARDSARQLVARAAAARPATTGDRTKAVIIGGDDDYIALTPSNAQYVPANGTFYVEFTLENRLGQPLSTIDGVSGADSTFAKVFLVSGSGVALAANPEGLGTFTASGQPFWIYRQVLLPAEVSAPQAWLFAVGGTPTIFEFVALVSARLPNESASGFFRGERRFEEIAAGGSSMCGVRPGFALYCWGDNANGQLGLGTVDRVGPVTVTRVGGPASYTQLVAGDRHACGLRPDNVAECWGSGLEGQLGAGSTYYAVAPGAVTVSGGGTYQRLAAGGATTCGIRLTGQLECWGDNRSAKTGQPGPDQVVAPAAVPGMTSVQSVAVGQRHACAVTTTGDLYCWGMNDEGQVGIGTMGPAVTVPTLVGSGYVSVAAGEAHSCALATDQTVSCWGRTADGQTGTALVPIVTPFRAPVAVSTGAFYTRIAAGGHVSCAVRASTNEVECWGRGVRGAVGHGVKGDARVPTPVMPGVAVSDVQVGGSHACARLPSQAIRCWGDNNAWQLGTTGVTGASLVPVTSTLAGGPLATGRDFTCVGLGSGDVACSGANGGGVISAASAVERSLPRGVASAMRFTQVAMGERFGCGVTEDRRLACWGANDEGQLGVGAGDVVGVPQVVPHPVAGFSWVRVTAGRAFACAVDNVQDLYCWGDNHRGQLGQDGFSAFTVGPQFVDAAVTAMSAGEEHLCYISTSRSVEIVCAGRGTEGQLGEGQTIDESAPVSVPLALGYTPLEIAAGGRFTCALVLNGNTGQNEVLCWGSNEQLQGGDFVAGILRSPSPIFATGNFAKLAAGRAHACATNNGFQLMCWGNNGAFQLLTTGVGQDIPRLRVGAASGAPTSMGSTSDLTCHRYSSAFWCWGGQQRYGEHGTGSFTPLRILAQPTLP